MLKKPRLLCVALREMESTSRLPLLVRGAVTPKGFIGVTERIFVLITVALGSALLGSPQGKLSANLGSPV